MEMIQKVRIESETLNYQFKYPVGVGERDWGYHMRDVPFSTTGRGHDTWATGSCADSHGPWWFKSCHDHAMNGVYRDFEVVGGTTNGAMWRFFNGDLAYVNLKESLKMIRPSSFIP